MKPKNSKRIIILTTVIVFLLVCVSFASVWTLANPTMETTHTLSISQRSAVVVQSHFDEEERKPIGEDPEPEQERSYTEPMYEDIELIVYDSIVEFNEPISQKKIKEEKEEINEEETIKIVEEEIIDSIVEEGPVYLAAASEPNVEEICYNEEEYYDVPIETNYYYDLNEEIIEEEFYEEDIDTSITDEFIDYDEEFYEEPISVETNYDLRSTIVETARSYVGVTPYIWAGDSLTEGTDCSGFVSLIYGSQGISASAGSNDYQYEYEHIEYEDLQPGDIVVYRDGGHVGIYTGDDTIIHCSNPEDGTIESDMWYSEPTAYVSLID